jgi:methionyl aminopeptidase
VEALEPGCPVFVIGQAIVQYVQRYYGFGVVEKYVGHGIGMKFHQRPNIPHVPNRPAQQARLYPGMCFTIEPMINGGTADSVCDRLDGWTVRTRDGRVSAQFEHTVLMTETGPELITVTKNGPKPGHRF